MMLFQYSQACTEVNRLFADMSPVLPSRRKYGTI